MTFEHDEKKKTSAQHSLCCTDTQHRTEAFGAPAVDIVAKKYIFRGLGRELFMIDATRDYLLGDEHLRTVNH